MDASTGCLSVVMPAYNEEQTIDEIIHRVLARTEVGELLIINDASTDKTWENLQKFADNPRIRLFNQEVNQGKGAALIRGFREAARPFVIVQDADFEYTPEDYPAVLAPLLAGKAVIQNLKLESCRFGIEVELTAKLARSRRLRIWEVPISYNPRRFDEGKKIGWKDGVAALCHIVRFNLFSSDEASFVRPWDEVLGNNR